MDRSWKWAVGIGCAAVLALGVWVCILAGRLVQDYTGGLVDRSADPANQALREEGTNLLFGVGHDVDPDGALKLFKQAHDHGDSLAGGYMYVVLQNKLPYDYKGDEMTKLYRQLSWHFTSQLNSGSIEAEYLYAAMWLSYASSNQHTEVYTYAKDAAEHDFMPAYSLLGVIYELGLGTQVDLDASRTWYEKSEEAGTVSGESGLGRLYTNPDWDKFDPARGIDLLKNAAKRNGRFAMLRLGEVYDQGIGVTADPKLAAQYYRQAADDGLPQAMVDLARCYRDGRGVDKDAAEERKWLEQANHWQSPEAQQMLSELAQQQNSGKDGGG